jgi:hypothetical protein
MANKRYDEFTPGTYDTSQIFLQANAVTGALEKVNLPPQGGRYCKFSKALLMNANNTGANPQTIGTIVIPAGTLSADGDVLEIEWYFSYLTAAGTKTIDIAAPFMTTFSITATAANIYRLWTNCIRIDSTHSLNHSRALTITASLPFNNWASTTCNWSISNTITFRVTAGAANDIQLQYAIAKVYSVA